jgi:hypothetical protein
MPTIKNSYRTTTAKEDEKPCRVFVVMYFSFSFFSCLASRERLSFSVLANNKTPNLAEYIACWPYTVREIEIYMYFYTHLR